MDSELRTAQIVLHIQLAIKVNFFWLKYISLKYIATVGSHFDIVERVGCHPKAPLFDEFGMRLKIHFS